jgi:hypothetical protein
LSERQREDGPSFVSVWANLQSWGAEPEWAAQQPDCRLNTGPASMVVAGITADGTTGSFSVRLTFTVNGAACGTVTNQATFVNVPAASASIQVACP